MLLFVSPSIQKFLSHFYLYGASFVCFFICWAVSFFVIFLLIVCHANTLVHLPQLILVISPSVCHSIPLTLSAPLSNFFSVFISLYLPHCGFPCRLILRPITLSLYFSPSLSPSLSHSLSFSVSLSFFLSLSFSSWLYKFIFIFFLSENMITTVFLWTGRNIWVLIGPFTFVPRGIG